MIEFIKQKHRVYLIEGIISEIKCYSEEKERHTFLGSTDRKAYTVETTCQWMNEQISGLTEIQPFMSGVESTISRIEEELKYTLANKVYEKYFNQQL